MLSAVASLLVTVGLLALGLWALKRFVPGAVRADGAAGLPFRLLRRLATGPKHAVALVQVGSRVLVVTLAEDGARMLTELEGEDRALALGEPAARPAAVPARPAFLRFLPVVALLLLAPAAAGAQAAARPATAASAVTGPVAPKVTLTIGQGADQLQLSGAVGRLGGGPAAHQLVDLVLIHDYTSLPREALGAPSRRWEWRTLLMRRPT